MKIVGTSNFAEETFSEFFPENGHQVSEEHMQAWCNARNSDTSPVYFTIVADNYELYKWEI